MRVDAHTSFRIRCKGHVSTTLTTPNDKGRGVLELFFIGAQWVQHREFPFFWFIWGFVDNKFMKESKQEQAPRHSGYWAHHVCGYITSCYDCVITTSGHGGVMVVTPLVSCPSSWLFMVVDGWSGMMVFGCYWGMCHHFFNGGGMLVGRCTMMIITSIIVVVVACH